MDTNVVKMLIVFGKIYFRNYFDKRCCKETTQMCGVTANSCILAL